MLYEFTIALNLLVLHSCPRFWVDSVHDRRPSKNVILGMGSRVSPTYGDEEGTPIPF
jgi:hypothetical protein